MSGSCPSVTACTRPFSRRWNGWLGCWKKSVTTPLRSGTPSISSAMIPCTRECIAISCAFTLLVAIWLHAEAFRATLSGLADVWLTEVARLLPDLLVQRPELPRPMPLTEGWQRQHLFEGLARALLGSRRPLLLLLDDVQWSDHETL